MNLIRVRWAVRGVLLLGVAASVAANILHAPDNIISQAISAWSPLALLLTVELISRIPVGSRLLAAARLLATAAIAGIAAWVSYWHMVEVAKRYGETGAAPYLLPISVDGLIVVASICLVELGQRLATEPAGQVATEPAGQVATEPAGQVATELASYEWPAAGQARKFAAADGQPVDHPYVDELNEYERRADLAMKDLGQELASEVEKFVASVPPGMPLPRRRPPVSPGVPDEARLLLQAWNGQPIGPDTPQRQAGTEVDLLLAAHFNVSQRMARRWRSAVLGPVSGTP